MNEDLDIHLALIISCFVLLAITVGTAVAMEKLPFSTALDTTKLEIEDLLPRRSSLRPRFEVK